MGSQSFPVTKPSASRARAERLSGVASASPSPRTLCKVFAAGCPADSGGPQCTPDHKPLGLGGRGLSPSQPLRPQILRRLQTFPSLPHRERVGGLSLIPALPTAAQFTHSGKSEGTGEISATAPTDDGNPERGGPFPPLALLDPLLSSFLLAFSLRPFSVSNFSGHSRFLPAPAAFRGPPAPQSHLPRPACFSLSPAP